MAAPQQRRVVTFDGEFTGLSFSSTNPADNQFPISMGFLIEDGSDITERRFLIRPPQEMLESPEWSEAEAIHGLTPDLFDPANQVWLTKDGKFTTTAPNAQDGAIKVDVLEPDEAAAEIRDIFKLDAPEPALLVGHSVTTDILVLNELMQATGHGPIGIENAICTKLLAGLRNYWSTGLHFLPGHLHMTYRQEKTHDALHDARITRELLGRLLSKNPKSWREAEPIVPLSDHQMELLDIIGPQTVITALLQMVLGDDVQVEFNIDDNLLHVFINPWDEQATKLLNALRAFDKDELDYAARKGRESTEFLTGIDKQESSARLDLQLTRIMRRWNPILKELEQHGALKPGQTKGMELNIN